MKHCKKKEKWLHKNSFQFEPKESQISVFAAIKHQEANDIISTNDQ